jgi:hypothetical protein
LINILNDTGVLLLGRFKDGGLERLNTIREWLQSKGYMAMIFDFVRPDNLNLIETIVTMAGLSKFIIADLSGPSVPGELQAIVAGFKKPILAFGEPYALFHDLSDKTRVIWINTNADHLLGEIENKLPELERLNSERIIDLANRDKN